ncbi:MAG TPA: hypothetical protein VMK42_00005 [Anaeromyxobacteraceae bacterium]|nr:hypothetical protein [Anaeromyxobacteraceae bacterium]
MRVPVIDPNPWFGLAPSRELERAGYSTVDACTPEDGVRALTQCPPRVVVINTTPGGDGALGSSAGPSLST